MRIEDVTSGYPRRYSRNNRTSRLPQPTDKGFHRNSDNTEELTEDKEGKNVHIEHIEDEILNGEDFLTRILKPMLVNFDQSIIKFALGWGHSVLLTKNKNA